ncbi:hypothetical protein D3C86_563010 [compost metagenome]
MVSMAATICSEPFACSRVAMATCPVSVFMRSIAWVIWAAALVCSSAESAIWPINVETRSDELTICPMVVPAALASSVPSRMAFSPCWVLLIAFSVSFWMPWINLAISPVALEERSASLRTSSATTAKPRPCSPARAASMAAFSARRLVCSAMSSMTSTISPISAERWPRPSITVTTSVMTEVIRCMPEMVCATA